jgi:xylulokinase
VAGRGRAPLERADARRLPERLLAIGGGARSLAWLQLMADALALPIRRPAGAEVGPALGAARLALLSLGLPAAQVLAAAPVARSFVPRPTATEALHERLERYRDACAPPRGLTRDTPSD